MMESLQDGTAKRRTKPISRLCTSFLHIYLVVVSKIMFYLGTARKLLHFTLIMLIFIISKFFLTIDTNKECINHSLHIVTHQF